MYFVTTLPTITAPRHIAGAPQPQVKEKTAMRMNLMMHAEQLSKPPQRMMHVIALALDMSPEAYRMKTRIRTIVEMRHLAALLMRQNYPGITLQQIARLFGGQDHTSILSGMARAQNLIATGDQRFIKKYNTVLNSVNRWLKGE